MSGSEATQREVIERLSIILRPARASMPAPPGPPADHARSGGSVHRSTARQSVRAGAMQQRYRLYRVCGYGVVSAWYYAVKSPVW